MTSEIEITPEFQQALDIINKTDKHLFITGKAGSGKSTLLDYCYKHCPKDLVLLAPTGVAALNIKGQTIHRFFNFPINVTVEKIQSLEVKPRSLGIFRNLDTIFIDEVSMLRADLLDCIDAFLQIYGPKPESTFGGVQMVFVGDMFQLPPVVTNDEQTLFANRYRSPYFFDAKVFQQIEPEIVELKHIYRQKDTEFITLLNRIRNNLADSADLARLNQQTSVSLSDDIFSIHLTTTNAQADEINQTRLDALPNPQHTAKANIEGTFGKEYFPTAEELTFKIGAQIMFLNNDAKNRWVNGSVGHIEDIKTDSEGNTTLKVRLKENAKSVRVQSYTWEIFQYKKDGDRIISESVGSFTQFPFRLAWAITIHKSQGKTFDHVEIDMGRGAFSAGQLYVALSRCTSLNGIRLTRPIKPQDIFTDFRILEFINRYTPLEQQEPLSAYNKHQMLESAIRTRQKLEVLYQRADGNKTRRVIVPLHIRGELLLAYCTERGAQRSFMIDRLLALRSSNEPTPTEATKL